MRRASTNLNWFRYVLIKPLFALLVFLPTGSLFLIPCTGWRVLTGMTRCSILGWGKVEWWVENMKNILLQQMYLFYWVISLFFNSSRVLLFYYFRNIKILSQILVKFWHFTFCFLRGRGIKVWKPKKSLDWLVHVQNKTLVYFLEPW